MNVRTVCPSALATRTVGVRSDIGVRPCWRIVSVTCHGLPGAVPSGRELRPTVAKPPAPAAAGRARSATPAASAARITDRLTMPSPPRARRCPDGTARPLYTAPGRAVPRSGADLDAPLRPDPQRAAPGEQLQQLVADELAAPALQRADRRLVGRARATAVTIRCRSARAASSS